MHRRGGRSVLVAGTSGAGTTTLAARLGQVLGSPQVEIDASSTGRVLRCERPSPPR